MDNVRSMRALKVSLAASLGEMRTGRPSWDALVDGIASAVLTVETGADQKLRVISLDDLLDPLGLRPSLRMRCNNTLQRELTSERDCPKALDVAASRPLLQRLPDHGKKRSCPSSPVRSRRREGLYVISSSLSNSMQPGS